MSIASTATIGDLLRDWRQRRRLSQLDLALEAQVSSRHLSSAPQPLHSLSKTHAIFRPFLLGAALASYPQVLASGGLSD
jgi:hypothetical protein